MVCNNLTRSSCKYYATTISRGRGRCQRECKKAGYPFPKDWAEKTRKKLNAFYIRHKKSQSRRIKHRKSRSRRIKHRKSRSRRIKHRKSRSRAAR